MVQKIRSQHSTGLLCCKNIKNRVPAEVLM